MDKTLAPGKIFGTISAPPAKSDAHRKLICGALGGTPCRIRLGGEASADIAATLHCLPALGATAEVSAGAIQLSPALRRGDFDCGESGSTLRFLLPVAAMLGLPGEFTGRGRLPERPIGELLTEFARHGVTATSPHLPLRLSGAWQGGEIALPGNVSSQYITGFLLALAASGGGKLRLTTPLQSSGYVDITCGVLRQFGVEVARSGEVFAVTGQLVSPEVVAVEGDWSNAAFLLGAGAVAGKVAVTGLDLNSPQGDRKIVELLQKFGAEVEAKPDRVTVRSGDLRGAGEIDLGDIPDLGPILAVVAAAAKGETTLANAGRLRAKESDRISSIAAMLGALGVAVETGADYLRISGLGRISGGVVDGANDHRIVMAASVAALAASGEVLIKGAEAVGKSWPDFWAAFAKLTI